MTDWINQIAAAIKGKNKEYTSDAVTIRNDGGTSVNPETLLANPIVQESIRSLGRTVDEEKKSEQIHESPVHAVGAR